jgi:acetyltransferase-like isoleucine patch superfamily enzyme
MARLIARLRTLLFTNVSVRLNLFYYRRVWGMQIGEGTRISRGAKLDRTFPGGITIGRDSAITHGAIIVTHDFVNREHRPVKIGDCCFVGYNAVVLPGVTVGDHSIIAAGSLVGRDVPPHSVVMGNPARVVEQNIQTGAWGIRLDKGNAVPAR